METKLVVSSLAALAQESRLSIFRLLVEAGPTGMAAGEIAAKLEVPPATLSFHLKELSHASLVDSRQDGRYIFYSANYERMNALIGFLTEKCCIRDCPPDCDSGDCSTPARRGSSSAAKRPQKKRIPS